MAKDPAMLFYTKDFLTGVALLKMKERGQYITLICLQQQLGHMTLQQMEQAVGKISQDLLAKYVQDEDGKYYNVRADIEIGKRQAHCENQKKNIEKRWGKKANADTVVDTKPIPDEYHGTYHGITTVIPLANASNKQDDIDQVKTGAQEERDKQFDAFWSVYPRKVGKGAARKAFDKIPKSAWPKLVPAVEQQKQSTQWRRDGGQYVPHPATWLNQGRWEDEVETVGPAKKYTTSAEYNPAKPIDLAALQETLGRI